MKRITIEFPDGYDEAVVITAVGREIIRAENEHTQVVANLTTQSAELEGHDGETLVLHPEEEHEWRKPETGWIPVEEKMPDPNVIVRVKGEDFEEEAFWGRFTHQWIDSISGVGVDNVTHWMPMSEPPEEV